MDTISIVKNDKRQCVKIEGITYSYEFFRQFGSAMPLDTLIAIKSREDGVLHVVEAEPGDLFKVKGGLPYKIPYVTGPAPADPYNPVANPSGAIPRPQKLSWFDRMLLWLGRR